MPKRITSRTLQDGTRRYTVRFPADDGKWVTRTFKREKDAKKHLRSLEDQREDGGVIVPTRATLDEYLDRYFEAVELRENTVESYRWVLKRYVQPTLGKTPVAKIKTIDVQGIYNGMKARGLSPRTIRYAHSVLHSALDQAVDWRLIRRNPTQGVKLPKPKPTRKIRYLQGDEVAAFVGSAWFDTLGVFFEVALATGCRPSELMGLRWQNVDLKAGEIHVRQSLVRDRNGWYLRDTKTENSTRSIPLPSPTVDSLREHKADQGRQRLKLGSSWQDHNLVFCSVIGEPLERHNLTNRHFKPTLQRAVNALYPAEKTDLSDHRAKMLKLTLYGLRHTAATTMIEQGVDAKTVSRRLGHKDVAFTLETYCHVTDGQRDAATAVLQGVLYE